MPLLGHGHHAQYPEQLMYTARCDGCSAAVRFTTSVSPEGSLADMDWLFDDEDCTRLLCSDCNPHAPGNHTTVPSGFYAAPSPQPRTGEGEG